MITNRIPYAILIASLLTGCGNKSATETEDAIVEGAPLPDKNTESSLIVEPPASDAATIRRGKLVFIRCRSCHTTEKDAVHLTGPNLNGLFGATAGTKEGYPFSEALKSSGVIWNVESLDRWIKQPAEYIPKNVMVFAGIESDDDRAALIAFLAEATQ